MGEHSNDKVVYMICEEVEKLVLVLLYKHLPLYRKTPKKTLYKHVMKAAAYALAQYAMLGMSEGADVSRGARRIGINRNTLAKLRKEMAAPRPLWLPPRTRSDVVTNRSDISRTRSNSK